MSIWKTYSRKGGLFIGLLAGFQPFTVDTADQTVTAIRYAITKRMEGAAV